MNTCIECMSYERCQQNQFEEIADLYGMDYDDIDEYLDKTNWLIDDKYACQYFTPKSDYVKRERGEWVKGHYEGGLFDGINFDECSICGYQRILEDVELKTQYKFCPNCGADNRKEQK